MKKLILILGIIFIVFCTTACRTTSGTGKASQPDSVSGASH